MEIVIDIPRKTYEHIRADGGHGYFNIYDEDNCIVTKAVFDGKKLPEHHGRLKDIDAFLSKVKADRKHACYVRSWTADDVLNALDNNYAPTIIEGSESK